MEGKTGTDRDNRPEYRDNRPEYCDNRPEYRDSRSEYKSSSVEDGSLLRPGERIDDLQRGGLRIIQEPSLFCFGMDAVLLSAYVRIKKARRGLDMGTGNGIIPLLLSDRTDCASLTGLEIQPESAGLAARSVVLNGLQDRVHIVQGDIREADRIFAPASFDLITCNPPYRAVGSGRITGTTSGLAKAPKEGVGTASELTRNLAGAAETASGNRQSPKGDVGTTSGLTRALKGGADFESKLPGYPDPRAIARHEILCTLDDVVRAASRLLRPGGHFYMVHRPMRLPEILTKLCAAGLEPKRMRLVYPYADKEPNMVLLDCVRGGAPELRVESPLIVYEKDGTYTPELKQIYYE